VEGVEQLLAELGVLRGWFEAFPEELPDMCGDVGGVCMGVEGVMKESFICDEFVHVEVGLLGGEGAYVRGYFEVFLHGLGEVLVDCSGVCECGVTYVEGTHVIVLILKLEGGLDDFPGFPLFSEEFTCFSGVIDVTA